MNELLSALSQFGIVEVDERHRTKTWAIEFDKSTMADVAVKLREFCQTFCEQYKWGFFNMVQLSGDTVCVKFYLS